MRKKDKTKLYIITLAAALVLFLGYQLFQYLKPFKPIAEITTGTIAPETSNAPFWFFAPSVGQCDMSVINLEGTVIVIDAADNTRKDEVLGKLKRATGGVIDYLILTHMHADHIGTAPEIIKEFEVKNLILNRPGTTPSTSIYERLLNAAVEKNLKPTEVKSGGELKTANGKIEFFCSENAQTNLNNESISVKISYKNHSMLFTGDTESKVENEYLKAGFDLNADILKVGHHGSKTSSTEKFLNSVSPAHAVIMVGDNNYGHPNEEVLKRLNKLGIVCLRTDLNGDILFESDGETISIKTEKGIT